jgi:tetratricopeptide (TPR) repeat protein
MLNANFCRLALPGLIVATIVLAAATIARAQAPSVNDLAGASTNELSEEARELYALGHRQLRKGDLEGALKSFSQVIEQRPNFAEAYLSRAQTYRRLEKQAKSVEDQDRYALGYINDERHVAKYSSRSFLQKELDEVLTKRVMALTAIYFVCWALVCYFWWYLDQSFLLAAILFFIAFCVALATEVPGRLPFGAGAVLFLVFVAAIKKRTAGDKHLDDQTGPRPTTVETETKLCPNCSREVSAIARVCPRCEQRF